MKKTHAILTALLFIVLALSGCSSDTSTSDEYEKRSLAIILDSVSNKNCDGNEHFVYRWVNKLTLHIEQFDVPSSYEDPRITAEIKADTIFIHEDTGNTITTDVFNHTIKYEGQNITYKITGLPFKSYVICIMRKGEKNGYRPFELEDTEYETSVKLRYKTDNYGTGTKVEHETSGILFTYALLNENLDPDSIFEQGERIRFYFAAKNNTKEKITYDSRNIGNVKNYGVIYKVETNEYIGKADAETTTSCEDYLFPGQTKRNYLYFPSSDPATYVTNSQFLEKGHYYTKFSGHMSCHLCTTDTHIINLPEFRIDFTIE